MRKNLKVNQSDKVPEANQVMKEINRQRNEQGVRRNLLREVCAKYGFDQKSVRQMHGYSLEISLPNKINFKQFLRLLRVDENP